MKFEEVKAKLTEVCKEPDSALVNITPVLEEIAKDYAAMESFKELNAKQEAKIRNLQDTNMKLFLAQTGQKEEDKEGEGEDDELVGQEATDAFVNKLLEQEKGGN